MESKMEVITSSTIRGIVQKANSDGVKKDQIVSLLKEGEQYVLVYYTQEEEEYY